MGFLWSKSLKLASLQVQGPNHMYRPNNYIFSHCPINTKAQIIWTNLMHMVSSDLV